MINNSPISKMSPAGIVAPLKAAERTEQSSSPHMQAEQPDRFEAALTESPSIRATEADESPHKGHGRAWKKGLYIALGVAAGLTFQVGSALISDTPAQPPSPQVAQTVQAQPISQAEKEALDNLDYLQQVAQKDGGGFKVDGLLFGQRQATPREAYQRMTEGEPIYYYESEGDEPVTIKSFEQLDKLRDDVEERVLRTKVRQGINEFKQDIKDGINEIKDSAREAWEDIFGHVTH